MNNPGHLLWIIFAALTGFFASFIFGDLLTLPLDLYYLIYFAIITTFFIIVVMTTAYHVGYTDFRSPKVIQANIGNTIMSMPTLLSANPVGTPMTHAALHITAVLHSPETELFLPPHREVKKTAD